MGPTLTFDKSFLQSLSVDEAAILDQLFSCVVTPLFFVEALGSLAKPIEPDRPTSVQIVAGLAERTPVSHGYMNTYHEDIVVSDLMGETASMDYRPAVAGGIPVRVQGKSGVVFEKSPEAEAFDRWQDGQFTLVEHRFARAWRARLASNRLEQEAAWYRSVLDREDRPKSHEAAFSRAGSIVEGAGQAYRLFRATCENFNLSEDATAVAVARWKRAGHIPLRKYAPFAAHCFHVELYFRLALTNGLISDQRASNSVDIAYLHYLPFAQVFVSTDRLHRTAAPMFLTSEQRFVWGAELKADLARLNQVFLDLPESEKQQGLFTLVKSPPRDDQGLCAKLWDALRPGWRTTPRPQPPMTAAQEQELLARSKGVIRAARNPGRLSPGPVTDPDHLVLMRHIPMRRGSWRMFSAAVEAAERRGESWDRG